MKLVEPAVSLRGALAVPGDKSISHRALLVSALASGKSQIAGLGRSDDMESTIRALRLLGVEIDGEAEVVRVSGVGLRGLQEASEPLDCGNAGTLIRLLTGIATGQPGTFVLTGDESLRRRPMDRVAEPLKLMGAHVDTVDGRPPITVRGGRSLQPIRYELPVASAQVKSAVLLAALFADDGPTVVVEPIATRDHTERLLREAGVRIQVGPGRVRVWPAERLEAVSVEVPGDFSAAAPFILAATLLPSSELILTGVGVNPTRIGFLHVLERMGARVSLFNRRTIGGEPVSDITVAHAELTATEIVPEEVPSLVDELPLFALAAAMAHGVSRVKGAQELREKETDRIGTVTNALRGIGARVEARYDGFRVRGVPTRPKGGGMDSGGDHRIAVLGAVAGLVSREGVRIESPEVVAVSFPGFFDLLDFVTQR